MATKPVQRKAAPVGGMAGLLTCPFTGKPIEIKVVGPDAHVMAVVPHLWSSRIFSSKQELIDALMTRNGVEPPWAKKRVSATPSVPPEDTDFMDDINALKKQNDEAANIK